MQAKVCLSVPVVTWSCSASAHGQALATVVSMVGIVWLALLLIALWAWFTKGTGRKWFVLPWGLLSILLIINVETTNVGRKDREAKNAALAEKSIVKASDFTLDYQGQSQRASVGVQVDERLQLRVSMACERDVIVTLTGSAEALQQASVVLHVDDLIPPDRVPENVERSNATGTLESLAYQMNARCAAMSKARLIVSIKDRAYNLVLARAITN